MIDSIEQGMLDIKSIEASYEEMRKRLHEYRFDNEQLQEENARLRENLARALGTIERLQSEEGEAPHV